MELREHSPHISCCNDDTQFCPLQCNNGACRCVDPITGNVVGSGLFFDEKNTDIDCIESKRRECFKLILGRFQPFKLLALDRSGSKCMLASTILCV